MGWDGLDGFDEILMQSNQNFRSWVGLSLCQVFLKSNPN